VLSVVNTAHNDANRAAIGDEAAQWFVSCGFTGGASAGNGVFFFQRIEDVSRIANKTVTLSFWANAGTALSIGVNLSQNFGTGGSPSATVFVGAQARALTTTLTRYSMTFTVPSIAGKTLGTAGDHNTQLELWFSAGSSNAARAGIGVQTGTINLWGVQLELGPTATPLEKLDLVTQYQQCQRFFQTGAAGMNTYGAAGTTAGYYVPFVVPMRAVPTVVLSGQSYINASAAAASVISFSSAVFAATVTALGPLVWATGFTASADL
jgi:hypothetical protein